jgi:hypothetical protein
VEQIIATMKQPKNYNVFYVRHATGEIIELKAGHEQKRKSIGAQYWQESCRS